MSRAPRTGAASFSGRAWFAFGLLALAAGGLVAKSVQLQLVDRDFLIGQGEARSVRNVTIEAHRGAIEDRNGRTLAVSTPVETVAASPRELAAAPEQWEALARQLKRRPEDLARHIKAYEKRDFMYLARHLPPAEAAAVRRLDVPGVMLQTEYRRYYPQGEVLSHVLGVTDLDDEGQEGLERSYDSWLAGEDGLKRVIKDNAGRRVDDLGSIRPVMPGRKLTVSIDTRIHYLAYRELKRAIDDNRAVSGSMVVLDVTTGEVLAMVNQPAFNPNDRAQFAKALAAGGARNRAAQDMFEPGSSIKPFVVAAALESGHFDRASVIDTGLGVYDEDGVHVEDPQPLGVLDLAGVLAKSSNVGMAKIARELKHEQLWTTLSRFGFGHVTASKFPAESAGSLPHFSRWRWTTVSSLSRGYNLSVTPLQLAQAYATIGAMGVARPVSLVRQDGEVPGKRVISEQTARTLISLLESVVTDGSGSRAAIPGYRVAGKTGTARKTKENERGYHEHRYLAVFGGLAPASNPRLAAVVLVDDPRAERYYGGEIAAPVFSAVIGGALRLMGIAPDAALDDGMDPVTGVATMVSR